MIKVLLAEDEFITRVGIRYCLDNAATPFQLIGEAVDGKQALKMCREFHPDILLTDIRMPEMDGIELIRQIRAEKLDIKILILTCLEEFSYLHEAMHLGIEDYILKTALKPEKLLEVLEHIRARYWSDSAAAPNALQDEASDALESILLGYVNDSDEIGRMVDQYHLNLRFDQYAMMLAMADEETKAPVQTLALMRGLRAAITEYIQQHTTGDAVRYDKKRIALLAACPQSCSTPEETEAFLSSLAEEINRVCQLNLNISLRFGISDIHHQATHIANALDEADCALSHIYFSPQERIYFFGKRSSEEHNITLRRLHTQLEALQEAASSQDQERFLRSLRRFEGAAREAAAQGTEIWPWYLHAYFDVRSAVSDSTDDTLSLGEPDLLNADIRHFQSPDSVIDTVTRLLKEIALNFGESRRAPSNALIQQVVTYTDEHFPENLTLDFIARTFSIHPAYFCKLFKRTMGTTYIDYLTHCRIRRAKELLKNTDLPNYLIAEQTGFQTPEYFSKIFKKKTGVSPKEYRLN